jgi:hypothetical protein
VPLSWGYVEPEVGFEPTTFRLRDGCSASIWTAPDGSGLLTLDGPSVQTDQTDPGPIVWMIKRMIKVHSTKNRMARQASPPAKRWQHTYLRALHLDPGSGRIVPHGTGRAFARRAACPPGEGLSHRSSGRSDGRSLSGP